MEKIRAGEEPKEPPDCRVGFAGRSSRGWGGDTRYTDVVLSPSPLSSFPPASLCARG